MVNLMNNRVLKDIVSLLQGIQCEFMVTCYYFVVIHREFLQIVIAH
jgi:hypothetical protein